MKKIVSISLIFTLSLGPLKANSIKKQKKEVQYNINQLALPSDVESIKKSAGAIYYSPSIKGKVLIPVHIWGSVKNSGIHFVPVNTNLISGISLAGGPSFGNTANNVYVTTTRNGKREKLQFDISKGGSLDLEDFKLQPGDTVYIPQDTFYQDRAYYTSMVGVIATILSSILLYRQVKN